MHIPSSCSGAGPEPLVAASLPWQQVQALTVQCWILISVLLFQTYQGRAGGHAAEAEGRVGIPAAGGEREPGEEAAACLGGNEAGNGGSPAEGDERVGTGEGAVPE